MTDLTHRERLDQDLYLTLNKLGVLLDDFDHRLFASSKLTNRQFWALAHLDERHGRPMADLARLLLTDKSNVTGIVDYLEKAGLAVRTPAPQDRRVTLIVLTEAGRRLRDRLHDGHRAVLGEVLARVEGQQAQRALAALTAIQASLEDYLTREPQPAERRLA
ncbi:MAG TPA: MarR family transcriptional regulator [Ktedonobacterales bacterium]|nr:MarR family transcriptional regulator [Ktedonobacterales bacterium]